MGEVNKEAWDILLLSIADVAKASREDKIYGKLYNAVRSGNLNTDDPDVAKFNGVFTELYIEQEVLYFGTRVVIQLFNRQDCWKSCISHTLEQ